MMYTQPAGRYWLRLFYHDSWAPSKMLIVTFTFLAAVHRDREELFQSTSCQEMVMIVLVHV